MKKRLIIAILLLLIPFVWSVITFDVLKMHIPVYKYDGLNRALMNPLRPGKVALFGTDRAGNHLFWVSLAGYRITLIFIVGATLITFIISAILGSLLAYKKGVFDFLTDASLSTYYFVPQAITAAMLMFPVVTAVNGVFVYPLSVRIAYMLAILSLVMLPTTVVLIRDEVRQILSTEYILAAKVVGATKIRQLLFHVLPNIRQRFVIIFMRTLYQALMVMSHISFLYIFFGGTKTCSGFSECSKGGFDLIVPELTTLLGYHMRDIFNAEWLFLVPCSFIVLTLIIIQYIADVLEYNQSKTER